MRISNLQALMLYQTLRDSLVVADKANLFTFNREQRKDLAESILNQQSRDYVELDIDDLVPLHSTDEGKTPPSKGKIK